MRVWRKDHTDVPGLLMSHYLHPPAGFDPAFSLASPLRMTSAIRNKPFACPIKQAGFFFQDRLIMITVKNQLLLYSYEITEQEKDSLIKRPSSCGQYQQVHACVHEGCQNITFAVCANSIQSPLLFTATSDRKVVIVDATEGKIVTSFDCLHEKSVHCIALPSPSIYTQLPSDIYNVFATAAIDNTVILWDLRDRTPVARYSGHLNRREEVGVSLSPCMKFLATGSEDRSARILDLRMMRQLAKLSGHRDVCSDVKFNPLFPQLVSCSYDGTIRFFADPSAAASDLAAFM